MDNNLKNLKEIFKNLNIPEDFQNFPSEKRMEILWPYIKVQTERFIETSNEKFDHKYFLEYIEEYMKREESSKIFKDVSSIDSVKEDIRFLIRQAKRAFISKIQSFKNSKKIFYKINDGRFVDEYGFIFLSSNDGTLFSIGKLGEKDLEKFFKLIEIKEDAFSICYL